MKKYFADFMESMDSKYALIFLVIIFSAICGFLYEEIFYRIDLGKWVKRGITYGPWITIYGIGGFFMALSTFKLRKHPILIFFFSGLLCGLIEFLAGWIIFTFFDGLRLWDYNVEIWNWGNICGYICFRSVLIFAAFGLMQNYAMIPMIKLIGKKVPSKPLNIISTVLISLFVLDIILSLIF